MEGILDSLDQARTWYLEAVDSRGTDPNLAGVDKDFASIYVPEHSLQRASFQIPQGEASVVKNIEELYAVSLCGFRSPDSDKCTPHDFSRAS